MCFAVLCSRDVEEQSAKNRAAGRVPSSRSKKNFKICTRLNDPRQSNKHCGGSHEQQICESVCRCVICGSDKHGAFQKEAVAATTEPAAASAAANDDRKTDASTAATTEQRPDAESKDQSDSPMPPSGSPSTGSAPLSRTASSETPAAAPASGTAVTLTRTSSSSKPTTRFLCPFQSNYDAEVRELTTAEGWINIKETLAHIGEVTVWRRAELEKTRAPPERASRAMEPRRWAGDARAETRGDRSSDRDSARDSAADVSAQPAAAGEDDDSWTTVPVREARSKKPLLATPAASETTSKHERESSLTGSKEGTAAERDRWRREPPATASAAATPAATPAVPSASPAAAPARAAPPASAPTAPWANLTRPPSNPTIASSDAAPSAVTAAAPAPAPAPVVAPYLAPSASESRWAGWSSGGAPVTHAAPAPVAAATGPFFASSALSAAPASQWSDAAISNDIAAWSLAATAAPPGRGYISPPAAAPHNGQMSSQGFVPRFSNAPLAAARSFVDPAAAPPAASTASFFAASPPLSSNYSMGGGLFFEQQLQQPQPPLAFAPSMWSTNGTAASSAAAAPPLTRPSVPAAIAPPRPVALPMAQAVMHPAAVAAAEQRRLQSSPPPAAGAVVSPSGSSSQPRAPVVAVKMASAPYVPAHSKAVGAPAAAAAAGGAAVAAPKIAMCPVPFANQRLINPRLTLQDACIICKKSLADPTHHPTA